MEAYNTQTIVLAITAFVVLFWKPVAGIQCYECNSVDYPTECGETVIQPVKSILINADCPGSCAIKTETTEAETTYERRCVHVALQDGCLPLTQTSTECICNTDLCNGSPRNHVHALATIATVLCIFYNYIFTSSLLQ